MRMVLQEARNAFRMLGKTPAFSVVAIVTLALGIGANTAIFTVANSVLLRPLPFSHPERLLMVSAASANERSDQRPMSWLRFATLRDQNSSFSGIAAFTNETFNLSGRGDPVQVASARVSGDFFDVLGVRPAMGRGFLANEDQPGGANVVLVPLVLDSNSGGRPGRNRPTFSRSIPATIPLLASCRPRFSSRRWAAASTCGRRELSNSIS